MSSRVDAAHVKVAAIPDTRASAQPRRRRERATTSGHVVRFTPFVRLETAAASVRGRQRTVNEDCHSALEGAQPLFVVADGVGGGALAAQASRELVFHLHAALDGRRIDAAAIRDALLAADREVEKSIAMRTDSSGAATVALAAGTGLLLRRWLVAWVGDCRVYRVSAETDEPAQLLTVDDTYRQLAEPPPPGGSDDDPARMVGNGAVSDPNVERVALHDAEMLVLVSDGVHKHVEPRDIARVLRGTAPLARRCGRLLALARTRGSSDDATVLVVQRQSRRARLTALLAAAMALVVVVVLLVLPL
jgi:serine/threonine protein phosphatase PrpC